MMHCPGEKWRRLTVALLISGAAFNIAARAQSPATLQTRIDAASPGDTIRVASGTYPGPLVLHRRIALIGDGFPVIRGPGTGTVVTVTADSCTISGFVIEGSGRRLMDEDSGIKILSGGNRILNNRLRDNSFGIYLMQANGNLVAGNDITGRRELIESDRGNGIHLWDARRNRIEANTIRGARDGVYFSFANQNEVTGNRVSDLRYGLHYMYSDSNRFRDNLFERNVAGAALMYSKHIRFRGNAFVHNRGHRAFGILLQSVEAVQAESNWVVDNRVGIMLDNASSCEFSRNQISDNDIAIQLFSTASGNRFWDNNFIDNLAEIQLEGRPSGNLWSRQGTGNYWSGYDGFDWNGDGIGDHPYAIRNVFDYLAATVPEFTLYLFSPAAQAIELTERLMPIVDAPEEIDPHPRMQPVAIPPPEGLGAETEPQRSGRLAAAALSALLGLAPLGLFWRAQRR